ncbi:hypothetical protein CCHL11_02781 [Colletotrichum chlorophyti]|nr:hypothetical protein CCHL11_02781 [Colletotrichum chlorophyti]
MAREPL